MTTWSQDMLVIICQESKKTTKTTTKVTIKQIIPLKNPLIEFFFRFGHERKTLVQTIPLFQNKFVKLIKKLKKIKIFLRKLFKSVLSFPSVFAKPF
jgi:hypothetical protein